MNRTLVLFTYYFPYTKVEAFIENEFPFLCKAFEKIIIITNELHATDKRPIPENVTIVRHPYHPSFRSKLSAIQAIFSKLFWEELKFIKAKLKLHLNKSILFTLLASITKGKETKDFILNEVAKKYELDIANTWFYSE